MATAPNLPFSILQTWSMCMKQSNFCMTAGCLVFSQKFIFWESSPKAWHQPVENLCILLWIVALMVSHR